MPTKVVVPETPDRTAEIIAEDIARIAEGVQKIRAGRLNDRALVTLLAASTGLGHGTLKLVLDALETLDKTFLKPGRKP